MAATTIHCTVIEIPSSEDNNAQDFQAPVKDLLPWADPYIASLMQTLEEAVSDTIDSVETRLTRCNSNRHINTAQPRSTNPEARQRFDSRPTHHHSANQFDRSFSRQRFF